MKYQSWSLWRKKIYRMTTSCSSTEDHSFVNFLMAFRTNWGSISLTRIISFFSWGYYNIHSFSHNPKENIVISTSVKRMIFSFFIEILYVDQNFSTSIWFNSIRKIQIKWKSTNPFLFMWKSMSVKHCGLVLSH